MATIIGPLYPSTKYRHDLPTLVIANTVNLYQLFEDSGRTKIKYAIVTHSTSWGPTDTLSVSVWFPHADSTTVPG